MSKQLRTVNLGVNRISVIEDPKGPYRSTSREAEYEVIAIPMTETPADTLRSLRSIVSPKPGDLTCLTPNAMKIIAFLEITWRNEFLEKEVIGITQGMARFVESKLPGKGAEYINMILDGWKAVLNRRKKWLYIGQVYDMAFLPAVKDNEAIRVPLFDSFMLKNMIDFISHRYGALYAISTQNKSSEYSHSNKFKESMALVSKTAFDFLQENKLYYFLKGNNKTVFNTLRPASDLKGDQIRVSAESGFQIGDMGCGLRHPVMTNVHTMKVVGYTPDHTIQISEALFQRFQADADGDFFLFSELIYKLTR